MFPWVFKRFPRFFEMWYSKNLEMFMMIVVRLERGKKSADVHREFQWGFLKVLRVA